MTKIDNFKFHFFRKLFVLEAFLVAAPSAVDVRMMTHVYSHFIVLSLKFPFAVKNILQMINFSSFSVMECVRNFFSAESGNSFSSFPPQIDVSTVQL